MLSCRVFRHASAVGSNLCRYMHAHILHSRKKVYLLYIDKPLSSSASCSSAAFSSSFCLEDICEHWTKEFQLHSISEPETSAELIAAHVLGLKTLYSIDKKSKMLSTSEVNEVTRLCQLRLSRMPVQYIIREWDFHDLTLKMRPPVLIPRPETEELANLCMDTVAQKGSLQNLKFLEIGSGSGAISIILLKTFKKMEGVAVDITHHACKLTAENAELTGVKDRLHVMEGDFIQDDVLQELLQHGPYFLIVSNPPYITSDEMKTLQPEILCYEDHQALDGGADGMNLIRQIILRSACLLQKPGHVWLEVAPQHPSSIKNLLGGIEKDKSLTLVETVSDVFGKQRFCHLLCS